MLSLIAVVFPYNVAIYLNCCDLLREYAHLFYGDSRMAKNKRINPTFGEALKSVRRANIPYSVMSETPSNS